MSLHHLLGVAHRPGAEAAGEDSRLHHQQALGHLLARDDCYNAKFSKLIFYQRKNALFLPEVGGLDFDTLPYFFMERGELQPHLTEILGGCGFVKYLTNYQFETMPLPTFLTFYVKTFLFFLASIYAKAF